MNKIRKEEHVFSSLRPLKYNGTSTSDLQYGSRISICHKVLALQHIGALVTHLLRVASCVAKQRLEKFCDASALEGVAPSYVHR